MYIKKKIGFVLHMKFIFCTFDYVYKQKAPSKLQEAKQQILNLLNPCVVVYKAVVGNVKSCCVLL